MNNIEYYYKHYVLKNILTSVSFICWLIERYIYLPIKGKVEDSALNYRLGNLRFRSDTVCRFRGMKVYQIYKKQNERYRKNMETIAKASESTGIPQHILLEHHNADETILFYKGNYLELLKYSFPSWRQIVESFRDLLIYFKQRWIEYVWKRFDDPYFYHWTRRVLSYRLRGNDPEKIFLIGYRWERQKYFREKRIGKKLRREKQIRYQKSLKDRLNNKATNAVIL
jgi:hypothetical protein